MSAVSLRAIGLLLAVAAFTCAAEAQGRAPAQAARPPAVLLKAMRPGIFYEAYLVDVMKPFRDAMRGRNGLDQAVVDETKGIREMEAVQRASAQFWMHDLDHDLRLTADEVRTSIERKAKELDPAGATPVSPANVAARVREIMAADTNGDGAVDYHEVQAYGRKRAQAAFPNFDLPGYMAVKPVNGPLTATYLLWLARVWFEYADKDGDGTLNLVEFQMAGGTFGPESQPKPNEECVLPKPGFDERIVVFGVNEGTAGSSVALDGFDEETRTAKVVVEPGDEPIYLVLSSVRQMIWRIQGATNRVSRVVLTSPRGTSEHSMAAVTGVERDLVTFTRPGKCVKPFTKADALEGIEAKAVVARLLERAPDRFGAEYAVRGVSVPSLEIEKTASAAPTAGRAGQDPADVARFVPGGLDVIEPTDVVWDGEPQVYDILPGRLGISQLYNQGRLTHLGGTKFKIVEPIARFPSGLGGALAVSFVLGKGVPMPAGSPGHSCVVSEETGQSIGQSGMMCR